MDSFTIPHGLRLAPWVPKSTNYVFDTSVTRNFFINGLRACRRGDRSGLNPSTIKFMADGLNEARALRVTELMRDYQNIQRRISQIQANPSSDEYHEVGYTTLRQCHAESRTLLNAPYPPEMLHPPTGPNEAQKRQLQRVIVDGSARRFQAQKINLRAAAAMKWINKRNSILQGQKPKNGHIPQLQAADNTLRADLAAITDSRIINGFRTHDQHAGYWLIEDPSLQTILSWIRSHH